MGPSSYAFRGMSDLLMSIDLYEVRPRKDHRGGRSNCRCAAIRSPVVWRTKCDQQRSRLRKSFTAVHTRQSFACLTNPAPWSRRTSQRVTFASRAHTEGYSYVAPFGDSMLLGAGTNQLSIGDGM